MNRRAVLVTMPVVVALVVGAIAGAMIARRGSGGGGGGGAPADTSTADVRHAPARTAAAGSSRVAVSLNLALGFVEASVSGDGVLDLRNGRGQLDLDLPVGSVAGLLDGGGTVYVKVAAIPLNREWIRLDLGEVFPESDSAVAPLGRLASSDPARALALLAQSAGDMHRVGSEPVRGTITTHSRGTFDLGFGGGLAETLGPAVLPLDVWVDGEGRMRKMAVRADPDGPGPLPASSLELEMYDFGVPADVVPPPANQVLTDVTGPAKAVAGLFR